MSKEVILPDQGRKESGEKTKPENKKDALYNPDELKWLKEQEAEYYRLKEIWDIPEDQEETEEIKEAKRKSLEILKSVKKLKMKKEPEMFQREYAPDEGFEIPIPDNQTMITAKIINGKVYCFALEQDDDEYNYNSFISDGYGLRLGEQCESIYGPMEYKGKLVFRVDDELGKEKLLDEKGKPIWENEGAKNIRNILSYGDKIYIARKISDRQIEITDIEGKEKYNITHLLEDAFVHQMVKWGDNMVFVVWSDQQTQLITGEGQLISAYTDANSLTCDQNELLFLSKRGSRNEWFGVAKFLNKYGNYSDERIFARIHEAKHADHMIVFEDGTAMMSVTENDGSINLICDERRSHIKSYDKIHEIKKIDEETIYILGERGKKLVKEVYKKEDIKWRN